MGWLVGWLGTFFFKDGTEYAWLVGLVGELVAQVVVNHSCAAIK